MIGKIKAAWQYFQKECRPNWTRGKIGPDFVVGGLDNPYLLRWWSLPRNPWFNIYLHLFLRDDDDRALHDHPWHNCSIVVKGEYREVTLTRQALAGFRMMREIWPEHWQAETSYWGDQRGVIRRRWSVTMRRPDCPHRIELTKGPAWTVFITGPRVRQWGFHAPRSWIHWRDFCDPADPGVARQPANDNSDAGRAAS